jgi:hydrocephalus-inducing protein
MTQMINSNVFAVEEKCFLFGTLFPSKTPDGIVEKFKISNFNKIPCTVKFDVRKRNEKQMEQFGFEVFPKTVKILPHEYCYVKVSFKPQIMA